MPTVKKITDELKQDVLKLRAQGYTYTRIAIMTDTPVNMVVGICKRAVSHPSAPKDNMTDLWILWDNLNHRYGGKKHV